MKRNPLVAVQHFGDGKVAILGEPTPGRVTLSVMTFGRVRGRLAMDGTPKEMGRLAVKLARVCLAVSRGRR